MACIHHSPLKLLIIYKLKSMLLHALLLYMPQDIVAYKEIQSKMIRLLVKYFDH